MNKKQHSDKEFERLFIEALQQSYEILNMPLSREIRTSWENLQRKIEKEISQRKETVA
jgi:uncharacterized UPF0160 family protein